MDSDSRDKTQSLLTNHELCTICQEKSKEPLVNTSHSNFRKDSYNKLLENIHKRAKLGNSKYLSGSNRLKNIDENYFIENKLSWHSSCYKTLTHKSDINREETNFQRGGAVKKIKLIHDGENEDSCSITVEPSPGPSVCTRS